MTALSPALHTPPSDAVTLKPAWGHWVPHQLKRCSVVTSGIPRPGDAVVPPTQGSRHRPGIPPIAIASLYFQVVSLRCWKEIEGPAPP